MSSFKFDRKKLLAIGMIGVGIILTNVSNNATKRNTNDDLRFWLFYPIFFLGLMLIIFGIKEVFTKGDS